MPQIENMNEEQKKKMKIYKAFAIKYECICGAIMIFESDTKPKKLQKCFKCNKLLDKIE